MPQLCIDHLSSGGLITNYRCMSRCGHCLYNCSPLRSGDYVDRGRAEKIFRRMAALGCCSVHIGGGEPLLSPEKLLDVLAAARDASVDIDYVETNSAWFIDRDQALEILRDLRSAGVVALLVSISPFHNAHIPFTRVRGVLAACRSAGMQVIPWTRDFLQEIECLDAHQPHAMAEYEAAFGADYLKRIPDRYWIHPGGRALATFRAVLPSHPADHILDHAPKNCARDLGDTSHFHIDLFGHYIPGLCAGLAIAMEDLGKPLAADKYMLLDRLVNGGIRALYELASRDWSYRPGRDAYLNHCDLCTEIRDFLRHSSNSPMAELAPHGFYAELHTTA